MVTQMAKSGKNHNCSAKTRPRCGHPARPQQDRGLPGRERPAASALGRVHACRVCGALEPVRALLGLPLPWFPVRNRRHRPQRPGRQAVGRGRAEPVIGDTRHAAHACPLSKNIAIFGTSAGGALALEMVLRAKQEGLPLPAAIAPGTPMSDTTKTGDTFYTNELLNNVLVSRDGFCDAGAKVYANGRDLKDPMLSPVYGDMHGFPPTILTSGTRDLLLSNTVRVHRKLRQAGVEAVLQVYEGQSHAHYIRDDTVPETKEVFGEIAGFFDKHLGR